MDWFLYDRDLRRERVNVLVNLNDPSYGEPSEAATGDVL